MWSAVNLLPTVLRRWFINLHAHMYHLNGNRDRSYVGADCLVTIVDRSLLYRQRSHMFLGDVFHFESAFECHRQIGL
jgi:hypothetical protein